MTLDTQIRNELRKAVQKAREVFTSDLVEVLEGTYGIHSDGRFEPLENLPQLADDDRGQETRELMHKVLPPAPETKGAKSQFQVSFDAVVRSLAFTHLNRLVAFKLMEDDSRNLIRETVGRGTKSNGFLRWAAKDPEQERLYSQGRHDEVYRNFLLAQCRELDREIGVLFDPADLASRVFPTPRALNGVLDLINDPSLAEIWADEETLGWVYQYYTPSELRKEARKHPAPRNPYEMAFLNQFYTPEYVVRFLVGNTLGRIWFEMRQGDTQLRETCEYLLFKPDEELPPRKKKDPRSIRVCDPACGSGHFLLYTFTVLQQIYSEAYEDPELGPTLQADFPDRSEFEKSVPALILEHNLFGIDIDRRATQIASLVLYLKAKTAHRDAVIERANIVCAEPMPGDSELREGFKNRKLTARGGALARLLDHTWETLELAGEVGSVLKLDEAISKALDNEQERWQEQQAEGGRTEMLFDDMKQPEQKWLDFSDVQGPEFWRYAEDRLTSLLAEYAEEAPGAENLRRRLFARNSAEGLHFIEVMRQRFDVVLMNPPFGACSVKAKPYIQKHYPRTKNDIYAVFVERFLFRLVPAGRLGAITSRTGFFLSSFQKWREEIVLGESRPIVVADLGHGVMDDAMVEAAAYVLERA